MNKKELIEAVNKKSYDWVKRKSVISLIKQLDEPEKVKIPQFVAEYIEQKKDDDYHLLGAMIEIRSHKNKEIDEWFYTDDNIELFARAWLDGYEVEEEKRYLVRMKSIREDHETLNCDKISNKWNFSSEKETTFFRTKHTRKELEEANFGWVFDCEGIEIEEVTE